MVLLCAFADRLGCGRDARLTMMAVSPGARKASFLGANLFFLGAETTGAIQDSYSDVTHLNNSEARFMPL